MSRQQPHQMAIKQFQTIFPSINVDRFGFKEESFLNALEVQSILFRA